MNKWLPLILCLIVLPGALSFTQSKEDAPGQVQAWSPRPVPGGLVDKVINGNLFVPNQRREPRVEPPSGEANNSEGPDENAPPPVEREPENPDRRYRLVGTSAETGRWLAFIENTETREVVRVAVDQEVASGSVTKIDYNRIEYANDGETTSVLIGCDLTGEPPQPPLNERLDNLFMPESAVSSRPDGSGASESSNNGSSGGNPSSAPPSDTDAQRAEILRRLRQRRERDSQ